VEYSTSKLLNNDPKLVEINLNNMKVGKSRGNLMEQLNISRELQCLKLNV
jgi:hypothetical protein